MTNRFDKTINREVAFNQYRSSPYIKTIFIIEKIKISFIDSSRKLLAQAEDIYYLHNVIFKGPKNYEIFILNIRTVPIKLNIQINEKTAI